MRNDNEIVYRQNMTRNEAVHILKAIAFPGSSVLSWIIYNQHVW